MSWIIIGLLGFAALLLVFSLFKKLVKLAFTAVLLLLLVAGIWYFWQQNPPEIPDSVRQAGEEAVETIKEAAGEAMEQAVDKAGEVIQEGAEVAMDKAGEAIQEGAEQAMDKAGEVVEDLTSEGETSQEPQDDPVEKDDGRQ